jgi:hypothetical protein
LSDWQYSMKKKIVNSYPCVCGHNKEVHASAGAPIWEEWCDGKELPWDLEWENVCECYSYHPDNLRYLEQLSKKKGKGK